MVVKMDITVNHLIGLRESGWLMPVNTLRFEDGEEIFCHGIVIGLPFLDIDGVMPYA